MLNDIRHVTQRAAVAATYVHTYIYCSLCHTHSLSLLLCMFVCISRSVIKRFFALIHDLCIQCSLRCRIRHSRRHREQTRWPLSEKKSSRCTCRCLRRRQQTSLAAATEAASTASTWSWQTWSSQQQVIHFFYPVAEPIFSVCVECVCVCVCAMCVASSVFGN